MKNPRLHAFARFFVDDVPPEFFRMSASPMTAQRVSLALKNGTPGCTATDLVGLMRLFLCLTEDPDEGIPWHQEPSELMDIPARLFYNLVLMRGDGYQCNIYRFDRLPPEMRKRIAEGVLLGLICDDVVLWRDFIAGEAGSEALRSIAQITARAG